MPRQWSPWFLFLPMLLMWHHTTQWSSGTAPLLLTGHYATPVVTWWSIASAPDLIERFLFSGVFYLALLPAFSRLPCGRQFNFKVSRASCWSSKHAPARIFVWITAIHKRFIRGRFYLRVRAGWPRNINPHEAFVLRNTSFTETLFLKYPLLTGFELSSQ